MPEQAPSSSDGDEKKLGWFPYVVALLSFVPLLGVLVGLACIAYGIVNRRRKGLIISSIGAAGVVCTIVLYGTLFYMARRPAGPFAQLHAELLATNTLPNMVKAVEFYKVQHGTYPNSLGDVGDDVKAQIKLEKNGRMNGLGDIYYERSPDGATYYLLTVGPDGKPFTKDDVLARFTDEQVKNTGYRRKH